MSEPGRPSIGTWPSRVDLRAPSLAWGRDYGVVIACGALFVALTIASDAFLTKTNLLNLVESSSDVGIVACAATILIVAGGFDLSVGAIIAVAGVISGKVAISTGVPAGILAGVLVGGALGVLNALMVTVGRVTAFVATLAAAIMFRSVAVVIAGGTRILPPQKSFGDLGSGRLLGVAYSTWIFVVVAVVLGFVLSRTSYGRRARAAGSSPETAWLSGISVPRTRAAAFVMSGLAAGIAGAIIASRGGQASSDVGIGYEINVIAAVAIGGTSIRGGDGAIWRTVVGVIFLALVNNGLDLLNVSNDYRSIVTGGLILCAVAVDALVRGNAKRAAGANL